MSLLDPTADDLIVLTQDNPVTANTFVSMSDLELALRLRMDSHYWSAASEADQVRAMVQAYHDMIRLPWLLDSYAAAGYGQSQTRDLGASLLTDDGIPLFADPGFPMLFESNFQSLIGRAQAAQVLFLLAGAKVRQLQRDGVRITRQLQGSEVEIIGYKGPVCVETLEILAPFLDWQPKIRAFARRRGFMR